MVQVDSGLGLHPAKGARKLYVLGLICLLTLLAYSNSFSASFHFDDAHQIVSNQHIRRLANVPSFFTSGESASILPGTKGYRPVNISSFALNYAVSGYKVWSYHLFNLVLHILNAFLVYVITSRIFGETGADKDKTHLLSLSSSLIFALHPIQTNAVTYISGRSAVLSAFFCLLGLYLFMRHRVAEGVKAKTAFALSALAVFYMGLLSKETVVVLLGLALAYDVIFTVPKKGGLAGFLKPGLIYIPFLAVLALYLAAKTFVQGAMTGSEIRYGHWEYLVSEARVLLMYVRLLILPVNQNADYSLPLAKSLDFRAGVSFLGVAAALYLLYRLRDRKPAAAFFGFWFFIAWAPESTFVPITDIAVEYRMYMPSIGFIAFMAAVADSAITLPSIKKWAAALTIVILAVLSFNRNDVWATEYSLWSDVVKKSPNSARAYNNLSSGLYEQGRYPEAIKALETALAVDSHDIKRDNVYNNLGLCLMKMGDNNGALKFFERVVQINPIHLEVYNNIGLVYYKQKRYQESEKALLKAIEINPSYAEAHSHLGQTYIMLGRYKDAIQESEEALGYDSMDFATNYNLSVAYYNAGMPGQAMERARITLGLAGNETERKGAEYLIANLRQSLNAPGKAGR